MNLLQAFKFLDMVTEDLDGYQEEYREYITSHKERVQQFADWLEENLPEVFEGVDLEAFDEIIAEHDNSKYSEEEFEAYAQHFYGDKKNKSEFEEAWLHHWQNNEHHPEFWLGEDMPYIYILEMLCDWGSFSIKSGNLEELINYYYDEARDDPEKNLSDATKEIIEDILDKIDSVLDKEE